MKYCLKDANRKVVGPGERTAGNWGLAPDGTVRPQLLFIEYFLALRQAVWFYRLLPHNALTYHVPQWRGSTRWGQSVMD